MTKIKTKVWSLVQNVTKDRTSLQNMTKKASKICPKFGHFFKMCPRSCQRLGHYVEIFQHGQSQTYPNFTILRRLILWHSISATTPSRCLPQSRLLQSWHNSECPGDLVPRGSVQGGPQHKFLLNSGFWRTNNFYCDTHPAERGLPDRVGIAS